MPDEHGENNTKILSADDAQSMSQLMVSTHAKEGGVLELDDEQKWKMLEL